MTSLTLEATDTEATDIKAVTRFGLEINLPRSISILAKWKKFFERAMIPHPQEWKKAVIL